MRKGINVIPRDLNGPYVYIYIHINILEDVHENITDDSFLMLKYCGE